MSLRRFFLCIFLTIGPSLLKKLYLCTKKSHTMTVSEIFELRKRGQLTEAYEAARQLYASDQHPHVSTAMFWTAVDMLNLCVKDGRTDTARKILQALETLLPQVPDSDGWVQKAYERCKRQLHNRKSGYNEVAEHTQLGIWGENIAANYLSDRGYIIMERNWQSGHRDLDIIARKDDCIIFVEVKTRRNTDFTTPEQAVDWKKRRNLRYTINHYVNFRHINLPIRFDIITVVGNLGTPHPIITHLEDIDITR